jgi:hypothetical protein
MLRNGPPELAASIGTALRAPTVVKGAGRTEIIPGGDPTRRETITTAEEELDFQEEQTSRTTEARLEQEYLMKATAAAPALAKGAEQAITEADNVIRELEEAMGGVTWLSSGLVGQFAAKFGGSSATDLRATVSTAQAALAFLRLDQMRKASPTGGALGQVSERELRLLESTIASLDPNQSPGQLKRNLAKVEKHFKTWRKAQMDYLRIQKAIAAGADPRRFYKQIGGPPQGGSESRESEADSGGLPPLPQGFELENQ